MPFRLPHRFRIPLVRAHTAFTVAVLLATAFSLVHSAAHAAEPTSPASQKTIIFLAGPKDHGIPGRHEYEKDLRALAHGLETSPNLPKLATKVFVGRAPRDLAEFENAAAIVIESSSDRLAKEVHPLFPPEPDHPNHTYDPDTIAYLKALDALIAKNRIGVVVFHYANWVEHWTARGYYLKWLGGLWVQMASRNPVDDWSMSPKTGDHPIFRGVQPWTYRDEVFCRFFLPDNDPARTDLLLGTPAKSPVGPQIVSWAYQREDGGRGFVMGGVDYHVNMHVEDYRRYLLNGIVWAAGLDVPQGGVQSTLPPAQ